MDINSQDMNVVRKMGMYVEFNARMKKDMPYQFHGPAAIRLADNTLVTLFPTRIVK